MAKDFTTMKPREVEAYFRQLLLSTFGNEVEDAAIVRASHGTYSINFGLNGEGYAFTFKKRTAPKIARAIRALK